MIPTLIALLAGCLTGSNYPDRYADAFCTALYTCVPADDIETWTGYDDASECRADVADSVRESKVYDDWEEGKCTFDKEAAQACIDEASQVMDDPDCDGEMDVLSFTFDALDDVCNGVYDC